MDRQNVIDRSGPYSTDLEAGRDLNLAVRLLVKIRAECYHAEPEEMRQLEEVLARLRQLRGDQAAELIGRFGRCMRWDL